MTTVADWIDETKLHLTGPFAGYFDELSVGVNDTATTLTLLLTERIVPNTVLSIGGEDVLVRSYDPASKEAVVRRGWRGSVATAHAAGDEVEVNPRFTNGQIKRALLQEVRSWPSGLFRPTVLTPTFEGPSTFIEVTGTYRQVLAVYATFPDLADVARHALPYVRREATATGFRLELGTVLTDGWEVEVHVAAPFDLSAWDDTTDLEATVGLQASMLDVGPMGAALRLIGFSEIPHSDRSAQGESRWAEESPAGHAAETMQQLWRFRNARLAEEISRMRDAYPMGGV